ncbi:MAG: exo-alpha-sialidase [Betaproteobacteria bacterium]|nr:exo-alpha-sialidase [Betaproteobacteria bacterium]
MTKGKMPTWDEQQITVAGFPHNIAPHLEGKTFLADGGDAVLPLADGALLHTYYGRLEGDRKYRLFAVVSDDGGLSWHYRATIADGQTMRAVREGPSEAATVRLDDGSLLCIYRVDSGAGIPFGRSISMDEGRTWKRLRPMYGKGSVKPQLARLADGTILLSGGRPGIYLWVCTDGMGRRWRRHDLVAHHNHSASKEDQYLTLTPGGGEAPALSTCYTSMQPIGPDAVLIAYERLGNGWGGSPGLHGATDAVFCLRARMSD